jgi:hypothetical protein
MDTVQLYSVLYSDPVIEKFFKGVFPSDKLPTSTLKGCIVVNEDSSKDVGSHWVAINNPGGHLEYFDSFGMEPSVPSIKRYLGSDSVVRNIQQLQSVAATTCGQHCIYFLYYRCRGVPFSTIVNSYSGNQMRNDQVVTEFVKSKFGLVTPRQDKEFVVRQISRALKKV